MNFLNLCSIDFELPIEFFEQEGEEGEAVTKQMHQGAVLVPAVWAGDLTRMVVTTTDQEAMVSISAVLDRTKVTKEQSMNRKIHSA